MKKRDVKLTLKIEFKSAFIIGSGFGFAGILDLMSIKDSNGIAYIPGSSLKGKIRSEFKKIMLTLDSSNICDNTVHKIPICQDKDIKDSCVVCRCFGSEFHEGSLIFEDAAPDMENYRNIFDFKKIISKAQSEARTGIRVNRILRTVEDKALFTYETINPSFVFTSAIHGSAWLTDDEYIVLVKTIENMTHLGKNKARGPGRCSITVMEEIST